MFILDLIRFFFEITVVLFSVVTTDLIRNLTRTIQYTRKSSLAPEIYMINRAQMTSQLFLLCNHSEPEINVTTATEQALESDIRDSL